MNSYTHPDSVSNPPASSRLHDKHNHSKKLSRKMSGICTLCYPPQKKSYPLATTSSTIPEDPWLEAAGSRHDEDCTSLNLGV